MNFSVIKERIPVLSSISDPREAFIYASDIGMITAIYVASKALGAQSHDGYKYSFAIAGFIVFMDDWGQYMTVRTKDGNMLLSSHYCDRYLNNPGHWVYEFMCGLDLMVQGVSLGKAS